MTPATPPTASVIWMHGLGADGTDFVPLVPELRLPDNSAPRFIFPNAPVRPVTVNNGMSMPAWYDIYSFGIKDREDAAGIRASAARVQGLIDREHAAGISTARIVLAGFSQGGAIALQAGLRYTQPLAGILALSTYLPLAASLATESSAANRAIPILMCHGRQDPVVPFASGTRGKELLEAHGFPVTWRPFDGGHEIPPPVLVDVDRFLFPQPG